MIMAGDDFDMAMAMICLNLETMTMALVTTGGLLPQSQILLHNERDKNHPRGRDPVARVRWGCCSGCSSPAAADWAITTFSSLAAEYRPPDIIGSPRCSSGTAGNSTDRSRTEADRFRRSSCWPSATGWPSGTASRAAWFGRCTASLARQTPDP